MQIARLSLPAAVLIVALMPCTAFAHCDTLEGPVVRDARQALDRGDPTPALKWVRPEGEAEVREAFDAARAVRGGGAEARRLADRYFYETLVRVHRMGEGEGFTGLKPAGAVEPCIAAADRSLDTGSSKRLSDDLARRLAEGVATRFRRAYALKSHAADSIEAGRAYVAAYVDYIHFVEAADRLARVGVTHGEAETPVH